MRRDPREPAELSLSGWLLVISLLVVLALIGACVSRGLDRFARVDIADRRVLISDLVDDAWTVCFDTHGTLCRSVGELRSESLFHLPEAVR